MLTFLSLTWECFMCALPVSKRHRVKRLRFILREYQCVCQSNKRLRREVQELKDAEIVDQTTGLLNGRGFKRQVTPYFEDHDQTRRNKDYHVIGSLILVDLDGMKSVNDTYGYNQGDAVIRFLARHLEKSFRKSVDIVARKHQDTGDEFLIFLPGVSESAAKQFLSKRRASFEKRTKKKFTDLHVELSFSYGVSPGRVTLQKTLNEAEENMHLDKEERKRSR